MPFGGQLLSSRNKSCENKIWLSITYLHNSVSWINIFPHMRGTDGDHLRGQDPGVLEYLPGKLKTPKQILRVNIYS